MVVLMRPHTASRAISRRLLNHLLLATEWQERTMPWPVAAGIAIDGSNSRNLLGAGGWISPDYRAETSPKQRDSHGSTGRIHIRAPCLAEDSRRPLPGKYCAWTQDRQGDARCRCAHVTVAGVRNVRSGLGTSRKYAEFLRK